MEPRSPLAVLRVWVRRHVNPIQQAQGCDAFCSERVFSSANTRNSQQPLQPVHVHIRFANTHHCRLQRAVGTHKNSLGQSAPEPLGAADAKATRTHYNFGEIRQTRGPALPCLALPGLALPGLALPCLAGSLLAAPYLPTWVWRTGYTPRAARLTASSALPTYLPTWVWRTGYTPRAARHVATYRSSERKKMVRHHG